MPPPLMTECAISMLVKRVSVLENRVSVEVIPGPEVVLAADPDQLEQMLINLLRNAVEASLETGGRVYASLRRTGSLTEVLVEDEGPGLSNTSNLFVPFFTTKAGGSGIGLVLSRQIAEAHGGSLDLRNRVPGPGCVARLLLQG